MAKSDTKKQRTPEIAVVWNENVPEATYFKSAEFCIVAKDTLRLMESLKVKNPDTLIRVLGKKFALKEPHKAFPKIQISLLRRGVPYKIVSVSAA